MEKDDNHTNVPLGDMDSMGDRAKSMAYEGIIDKKVISKIQPKLPRESDQDFKEINFKEGNLNENIPIVSNKFAGKVEPENNSGLDYLARVGSKAKNFFVKNEEMDAIDKRISESKLKFGDYYIRNKHEDKKSLVESQDHLIDEKQKKADADKSKYEGKEKEYGLGDEPYHTWDNKKIVSHFGNDEIAGFNKEAVESLRKKHGLNRITPKKSTPWFLKLIINMFGGFQIFLWVGGILCVIVYIITEFHDYQTLALGILCFLVVIGTSIFQTYQEGKSNDVMAALRALTPEDVKCLRDGKIEKIPSIELVPGDIIQVMKGEKVPADVRVLKSDKLKVNNASLTGENVDINLTPHTDALTLYEAKNIARMGCNFTGGEGTCIVFSTGDNTFFGHIAKSTLNIKRPDSCLTKEIKRLVHIMGAIAITIGIIFLILSLVSGYKPVEAVVFMIGIIVANVPEGLLPQMTVALTLTAKKMQKKDVVVTNLEIIETLGAVSVICSDKTGTLTCNRMTVSHLSYDLNIFGLHKEGVEKHEKYTAYDLKDKEAVKRMGIEKEFVYENPSFQKLFEVMLVNSNARFDKEDSNLNVLDRSITGGDPSEAALIKFAQPLYDVEKYRSQYTKVHEIPFNSNNKWMFKICKNVANPNLNNGRYSYYLKGAPEKVLNYCKYYLHEGKIKPMEADYKIVDLLGLNERLAAEGERVLAFAYKIAEKDYPEKYEYPEDSPDKKEGFDFGNFIYVGLVSLQDPPRTGVKESIAKCNEAGIRVFMVTGDQPLTALSIAKQLGLVSSENNGNDLLREIEEEHKNSKNKPRDVVINPRDVEIEMREKPKLNSDKNRLESEGNVLNGNNNENNKNMTEYEKVWRQKIEKFGWIQVKGRKKESLINGFIVVNGVELLNYTEEDWDRTFAFKDIVFARTMPQQKQDIVSQLRRKDEIIAMTGDGVNDAPALKAAHVGIAMGSGASVAKEAGQLILLKDDFSNIVDGIGEGRLIFENLKKCICYVLASNIPELIPFLLFIIIKIPLSIETIMIILIDVGTDLAPAISLAWEMEENETMKLPPRSLDDHLVGIKLMLVAYLYIGLIMTFCAYFSWAWVYYDHGFTINDLIGAGIGYRETWEKMTQEQREFFAALCQNNSWYQTNKVTALGKNCGQDFKDFMVELLAISQSAFLMTVVWAQIPCIFVRKTASESIFSWKRMMNNIPLWWSLLIEIATILIVIYIPGLNSALLLTSVKPLYASTGLWVIPVIFIFEEFRKYLIRRSPNGWVSRWTKF